MKKLLETIGRWLINIGNKGYYDFGEPVVHVYQYKDQLIVATKRSLFSSSDGETFTRIER